MMHFGYKEVGLLIKAVAYYLARHQKATRERNEMQELLEKLYKLN